MNWKKKQQNIQPNGMPTDTHTYNKLYARKKRQLKVSKKNKITAIAAATAPANKF